MDVTRLTEEEQIALAIEMSMTQAEGANDVEMKEDVATAKVNLSRILIRTTSDFVSLS